MEITFKFTDDEMRNPEVIRETILKLFGTPILREDVGTPLEEAGQPIKTSKKKTKTKEERVAELKEYANSIYKSLTDAQKKSLKRFVAFYTDKINQQDFNINPEKQFNEWWDKDKNNK